MSFAEHVDATLLFFEFVGFVQLYLEKVFFRSPTDVVCVTGCRYRRGAYRSGKLGLRGEKRRAPLGEAATNIGSAGETAGLPRHLAQVLLILDLVVVVVRDLVEGRLVGVE